MVIPWPDSNRGFVSATIHGNDEERSTNAPNYRQIRVRLLNASTGDGLAPCEKNDSPR